MFLDREDAGFKLSPKLKQFYNKKDTVVVGLTKGGVITARSISLRLNLKLKALIVKKISSLQNPELALGAMISLKDIYWNKSLIKNISANEKKQLVLEKQKEIDKLNKLLKIETKADDYNNKTVILVDDGVATGASVIAASKYIKRQNSKKIILAAPIVAFDTLSHIDKYFDSILYLEKRKDFYAVGQFYDNFDQISDKEVAKILI